MTHDLVAEILRATGTLRAGDPSGATAIIQAALAAGGLAPTTLQAPAAAGRPRRPLGEVIRLLRSGRGRLAPDGPRAPVADPPLPEGAEFRDLHFGSAAGARRYRLYVPASAGDGLQGLVVMLHGCTQTPEDFAAGTGMNRLAETHRLLVAYPAQAGGDNPMSCWNWFRPQDQAHGAGEPAILAGLAAHLRDAFALPADRVFVAGLSAGGAMAAILAEAYPEVFAAVGIHSGLAAGAAGDVASAFAAMRGQATSAPPPVQAGPAPRTIVFHGSADQTVHPVNARHIVERRPGAPGVTRRSDHPAAPGRRAATRMVTERPDGTPELECWIVEGAGHAWLGGHASGSYTDPTGPDASAEMVRFFLAGPSRPR
jgi:poly(hydroxyalkanoate) depolymerase family esterase